MKQRKTDEGMFRKRNGAVAAAVAAMIGLWLLSLLATRYAHPLKSIVNAAALLASIGAYVLYLKKKQQDAQALQRQEAEELAELETIMGKAPLANPAVDYLLMLSSANSRFYQVFRGPSHYLFVHVGNEVTGIKEDKLLTHIPSPLELQERGRKNYAIAKSDIQSGEIRFGRSAARIGHSRMKRSWRTFAAGRPIRSAAAGSRLCAPSCWWRRSSLVSGSGPLCYALFSALHAKPAAADRGGGAAVLLPGGL